MKHAVFIAIGMFTAIVAPVAAQEANAPGLGEVVVTSNRLNARYAQQDRPVVGLRRQADSVVVGVMFSSDSRDEETRRREINTMLIAALDRAAAAGVEIVNGNFELSPVSKTSGEKLALQSGNRVDTSRLDLMVKAKLTGTATAAEQKLDTFINGIPKTGRGAVDKTGSLTLTIINPDQYRDTIVKLVAESARQYAAVFGSDYGVQVSGIDGQVSWSQVSNTDVFLYIPYRYVIVPK